MVAALLHCTGLKLQSQHRKISENRSIARLHNRASAAFLQSGLTVYVLSSSLAEEQWDERRGRGEERLEAHSCDSLSPLPVANSPVCSSLHESRIRFDARRSRILRWLRKQRRRPA